MRKCQNCGTALGCSCQVRKLPNIRNWRNIENIKDFDYSWHPDNREPPFMYQFGTQWQKTGGPIYVASGSTQTKYCSDIKATKLPQERNWRIIEPIEEFDYSWHPDETDGPYNYIFGNQYHCSEHMPTLMYKMKGAEENKYINNINNLVWQYGTCNNRVARRHRIYKNVQFILWKAGEQGHIEDYWHNFDRSWWSQFIPNE
jgi:hypothetical protein